MNWNTIKNVGVNLCRFALAATFVFSGYVKAIDPTGTQYKLDDYLAAVGMEGVVPEYLVVAAAVALATVEFCLGIFMLFAVRRRLVSKLVVAFMTVMTLLTVWIAVANPVKDCGCFGDAVVLTNWQTLWKNVALLAAAVAVARRPLAMVRFISRTNQWIVINYAIVFCVAVSSYCLYDLPLFDFRPYHIGANIRQGMEIPEGAEQPEFSTTFILEKNGERKEFSIDDYPDSTWTFVDSRTVQTKEGYVPPIHDFSMEDLTTGNDMTDVILDDKGYTFLLVAPYLETANDSNFGTINQINDYCKLHGYHFYALTASNRQAINRWNDMTGAEYQFLFTDGTTLKTIIRSNPGLLLLKGGTIINKWSNNALPELTAASPALEKSELGRAAVASAGKKIACSVAWFFLPLLLLTIADRMWAWTKWIRRPKDSEGEPEAREQDAEGKAEDSDD